MANDADEIKDVFDLHPCGTPRGMLYYNLSELTDEQQVLLNEHKLDIVRDNQHYLRDHPEIKIVISMILKAILKERPIVNVQEYLAKYLTESWKDIKKEIEKCVAEREMKAAINRAVPSATSVLEGLNLNISEEGFEEEYQPSEDITALPVNTHTMCKGILEELIDKLVDYKHDGVAVVVPPKHHIDDLSANSEIIFPSHFDSLPSIEACYRNI